jgi:hypothetical protein
MRRPTPRTSRTARAAAGSLVIALAAVCHVAPSVALAQPQPTPAKKQREYKPPTPLPPTNPPSNPMQMGVAVLLLAIVLAVSLIPSKRGHQD